jgi:hypothetical protein
MMSKQPYYPAINNPDGIDHQPLSTMRRKFTWPFLLALLILILSEYFFLEEIFGRSNIVILLLTGIGIASSIFSIVSLIRKHN